MRFEDVRSKSDIEEYLKKHAERVNDKRRLEDLWAAIYGPNSASVVQAFGGSSPGDPTVTKALKVLDIRQDHEALAVETDRVWQALYALDVEEENVVWWRCISRERYSMDQIARKLPASRRTVYRRWDSALGKIAAKWGIA